MSFEFYDVRSKQRVEVPKDAVYKVSFSKQTKLGKTRIRYALRARYEGRKLMKFVSKETFENTDVPEESL